MVMFTKEYKQQLAEELAQVRADNRSEGSPEFQYAMSILQDDEQYDADFNDVISISDTL